MGPQNRPSNKGYNDKVPIKVCHVTSVHSSDDTRVFHKECSTLARYGYNVTLVAPGKSRDDKGVRVIGCGNKPNNRIKRMFSFARHVCSEALLIDADIYHFHDPELLLYTSRFLAKRKKIIFDSHEDYNFEKDYLPKMVRKPVNKAYLMFEKKVAKKLSGIVCCYEWTRERLKPFCNNIEMIYNFPVLPSDFDKTDSISSSNEANSLTIGYAGGIDSIWNHKTILKAISSIDNIKYIIAGVYNEKYLSELKALESWKKVNFLGRIPHDNVQKNIYGKSDLGIALLSYIPECKGNYGNMSNTKLFEIMMAGLPVIATDFVLWKKIVLDNKCGICVDPNDIEQVRDAIQWMIAHPDERNTMGRNAKRAVEEEYNWGKESIKLLDFYQRVADL